MNDWKECELRDRGFEFWGTITASLSHEMNNVFAIINELSGLLEDYSLASDRGKSIYPDKVKAATRRISEQVSRGRGLVRQLNRLAHTVDRERSPIDFNEDVETVATLCARLATLRRIGIETRLPDASPQLEGSAFDVQHMVFRCIDMAFEAGGQGDVVEIEVKPRDDGARLGVTNRMAVASVDELKAKRDSLAALVARMNGTVEAAIETGRPLGLAVSLPHSLNTGGNHDE
jgi:signal transduction histidine kinase